MSEEKLAFLRVEDATQETLNSLSESIEEGLPDNYNVVLVSDGIVFAEPDEMMEMFLHMFQFIESNCYKDKAEAHETLDPEQENLRNCVEKFVEE